MTDGTANMFSRFDTIPACDGHTDGQTDTDRLYYSTFSEPRSDMSMTLRPL